MSPTKTDGFDDFFEAVKDIRDRQSVYTSGKSFSEMLSAHEGMRERQRIRDIAQAAQESNALLSEKNRLEKERNSLLEREAEEREAERRRIAKLPDCPECQAKVGGNRPERCAHCTCRLYWIGNRPVKASDAKAYLDAPTSCPDVRAAIQELEDAQCSLRIAAESFGKSFPLGTPSHESITQYCTNTISGWETRREQALHELHDELSRLESEKAALAQRANARYGAWLLFAILPGCLGVGCLFPAILFSPLLLADDGFRPFILKMGALGILCLGVFEILRRTGRTQAAKLSREADFDAQINSLNARRRAVWDMSPEPSVQSALALVEATEVLHEVLQNSDSLCCDWQAMATSCERPERAVPAPLEAALHAARSFLEKDMLLLCAAQPDGPEVRIEKDAGNAIEDTAKRLLQALCVVAAVDGKLHNDELAAIAAAVRDAGCPLGDEAMRATAIKACQEIYKAGVIEYAQLLCREWQPLKGTSFAKLVVRLQQQVAAADGRQGNRETQLLDFFQSNLGVT